VRERELTEHMSRYLADRIERDPAIEFLLHSEVRELIHPLARRSARAGRRRPAREGGEGRARGPPAATPIMGFARLARLRR
jgi:hypothetical protein